MKKSSLNNGLYEPKEFVEPPFYTVAEAMRLTGLSSTKFRYEPNKRELDSRGADLSQRVWRIPRSALIDMGWLSPDAPLRVVTADSEKVPVRGSVKRIKELYEEAARLRTLLSERDIQLAVANATVKAKDAEIANLLSLLQER